MLKTVNWKHIWPLNDSDPVMFCFLLTKPVSSHISFILTYVYLKLPKF